MKNFKLIASLSVLLLLVSCGDTAVETAVSDTGVTTDSGTTAVSSDYYDGLEGYNYDGYTFSILSYAEDNGWPLYLTSDGETGELLNDAAFRRNLEVSELLNCEITAVLDGNYETLFKNAVLSGEGETYDLICFFSPGARASYVTENMVYDWKEIPHLNLTSPWYVQDANDVFTIADKQYFAISDITFAGQQFASILCNLKMVENLDLESPYTLVNNGTWTLDAMHEMAKSVYMDLNNDGIEDENDQMGLLGHANVFGRFVFCADEPEVCTTEDGFALNLYSDKIISLVDKLRQMQNEQGIMLYDDPLTPFMNETVLFALYASDPAKLRDLEFDYGYLLFPKYDVSQETYITEAAGGHMAVPIVAADIDRSGVIIEALSAASNKYMSEAFINTYIENKVLRDAESIANYRLMRQTSRYNISYNIDPSDKLASHKYYSQLWNNHSLALSSYYESQQTAIQQAYDNLVSTAKEMQQ